MKTTLIYILCVLFNFLLFSCYRNKQQETVCSSANTVLVPQDLKDRFFFKEGTYWIYQNLNTKETDSIWVFSSTSNTAPVNAKVFGDGFNKCYEIFDIKSKSSKFPDAYYYNYWGVTYYPIKEVGSNKELFGLEDLTPINGYSQIYRIEIRGNRYENQDGAEITSVDSITTKTNIIFKDVLHLKYPAGFQTQDYLDNMHYAKNIGLVKFYRFADSSNWELIRYNIIQ